MELYTKQYRQKMRLFEKKTTLSTENHFATPHSKTETTAASCISIDTSDFEQNVKWENGAIQKEEFNDYFALIEQIAEKYDGQRHRVDSGNEQLIFYASNDADNHAQQATKAAYELMDKVVKLNTNRRMLRKVPFRLGIGVHTGQMATDVNAIAKTDKPIQIAAHLSALNCTTPIHTIFVSGETVERLDEADIHGIIEPLGNLKPIGAAPNLRMFAVIHEEL